MPTCGDPIGRSSAAVESGTASPSSILADECVTCVTGAEAPAATQVEPLAGAHATTDVEAEVGMKAAALEEVKVEIESGANEDATADLEQHVVRDAEAGSMAEAGEEAEAEAGLEAAVGESAGGKVASAGDVATEAEDVRPPQLDGITAACDRPGQHTTEVVASSVCVAAPPRARAMPILGEMIQVEIDDEGVVMWKDAEVRQVMPQKFYVCVEDDEDFIESYGLEDEFKEWRRTGQVNDVAGREVSKVEVREYLVKLRGYSHRQTKWMVAAEVEEDGSLSANALKKFEKRL